MTRALRLSAVWLLASLPLAAQDLPPAPAALVAEALRLRADVGDRVWPGFAAVRTPIVLQIGAHDFLIDHPDVDGFAPGKAPDVLAGKSVQVGPRAQAADLLAAFPAHGTPAVVVAPPDATERAPTAWVLAVVHEMFHVMQMQRGEHAKVGELAIAPSGDGSWQLDFPFPYEDGTAAALVHQQAWPCYAGAHLLDVDEARYAAGVAAEAAASLAKYLEAAEAPAKAAEYARFQCWKEGVAKWVERETARQAAQGSAAPLPQAAAVAGFVPYAQAWQDGYDGQRFLAKHAGRAARSRLMFYHLGMAQALLLERLDPTWKDVYFTRGVWLDDMLRQVAGGGPCTDLR